MAKTGKYSIGVDLGGTKILGAVVDDKGKVAGRAKKATQAEQGPKHVIGRIIKVIDEAMAAAEIDKSQIVSFGMGAPGTVDSKNGVVVNLTNLPGWQNIQLASILRKEWLNVPITLSNDVRVAAVGEHRVGAGVGVDNLIAVFVGTGLGGGLILNGKVFEGARGTAGEIGHMVMMIDGPYAFGSGVRGGMQEQMAGGPTYVTNSVDRGLRIEHFHAEGLIGPNRRSTMKWFRRQLDVAARQDAQTTLRRNP